MNTPTSLSLEENLTAAAQWCTKRGEKLTDQRREVLSLLLAAPGSMKAYDLLAAIQKQKPTAAPPTVYRALDFLVAAGLAHKLESKNAFVACCDFEHPHHGVMLICDQCLTVKELSDETLEARLIEDAAAYGFSVAAQDIEVKGLCANCRNSESEGKP
ncbi:Fur family transcriptional regulator [Chitinimonas sp. BJB300]|uniref:Fur family transcriptional regulator n=1 Tax=Chitinimonas sp. BJB300 TaxID=1559339 RepID=UPI000C0F154A|nr:Fur family transcriptional regulator [Chitinimonas sp. BJB300]PHV11079.1 Fur family transcriptional regulator [Chitinimonas sp. BJB300]TSJ89704.1 transcriptional repressor [Chitinimonas sp. BJB300]